MTNFIKPAILLFGMSLVCLPTVLVAQTAQALRNSVCGATANGLKPAAIKLSGYSSGQAIANPKPAYPPEAKRRGIRGTVVVDVVVDEKGKVIWAKPISGPKALRASAMSAACKSRFVPGVQAGRNVKASFKVRYRFSG